MVDVACGQMAGAYRYDAFGARTVTGEAIRYGFTGREHDASGLIYYRARHYYPQTGRFLQADPIGFAAGDLNIYAYVWNDPFNWTDPSGLAVTADWANLTARATFFAGLAYTLSSLLQDLFAQINFNVNNSDSADNSSTPGTWPFSMSDVGSIAEAGNNDPCRGLRRQLRRHMDKLDRFNENPYSETDTLGLRTGNPIYDEAYIVLRRISLTRQVMHHAHLVMQCEAQHGMR